MASQQPSSSSNPSLTRPLKSIIILGATGNIGLPIIRALASHPSADYTITAVTRNPSKLPSNFFPSGVKVASSDYTPSTLRPFFLNADAVISCLSVVALGLAQQKTIIDLAIECGVARFVPGQFGVNTTHPDAARLFPLIKPKIEVREYLTGKVREGKIGSTTVFNGAFFDWFFRFPGDMGWDVDGGRCTVYDGGDVAYEVTTMDRIAEATAAALSPDHADETMNEDVFINSWTVTQNQILKALRQVVGKEFDVREDTVEGLVARVREQGGDEERMIAATLLEACLGGDGALDLYSRDPSVGGLWNERLGLKKENLQQALRDVVDAGKLDGMPRT